MTSNVVCDYQDAVWEVNSRGQNACTVYASLQGLCDSTFVINSVNANSTAYTPPNNSCGCNVVAYNLMAGCGWCQSQIQIPWWLTVEQWQGNCTAVPYNAVSIPPNLNAASLTIPEWARALPTSTTWSPSQASLIAVAALSSTSALASGTGTRSSSSSSTRFFTNTPFTPIQGPVQSSGSGAKAGLVAILVIFGLYAFAGLVVVGIYFFRQKQRIAWYRPMAEFYRQQKSGGAFNPAAPLMHNNNNPSGFFHPQNMGGQYGQQQQYGQQPHPWTAPPGVPSPSSTSMGSALASTTISSNGYAPPPPEHTHGEAYSSGYGSGTGSTSHSTSQGHVNGANGGGASLTPYANPFTTPGASSSTMNVAANGSAHTVAQYPSTQKQNQANSYGYTPPGAAASVAAPSTVGSSTAGTNTMSVYSTSTNPYGGIAASVYGTPAGYNPNSNPGPGAGVYGAPSGPSQYTNAKAGYSGRPEAH